MARVSVFICTQLRVDVYKYTTCIGVWAAFYPNKAMNRLANTPLAIYYTATQSMTLKTCFHPPPSELCPLNYTTVHNVAQ